MMRDKEHGGCLFRPSRFRDNQHGNQETGECLEQKRLHFKPPSLFYPTCLSLCFQPPQFLPISQRSVCRSVSPVCPYRIPLCSSFSSFPLSKFQSSSSCHSAALFISPSVFVSLSFPVSVISLPPSPSPSPSLSVSLLCCFLCFPPLPSFLHTKHRKKRCHPCFLIKSYQALCNPKGGWGNRAFWHILPSTITALHSSKQHKAKMTFYILLCGWSNIMSVNLAPFKYLFQGSTKTAWSRVRMTKKVATKVTVVPFLRIPS